MDLSIEEQIFEQFKKANKVLIALPENLTADSLSSGLALMMFLEKLEKDVEIVSSGNLPNALKFLPQTAKVRTNIENLKSLVAVVNTSNKPLEEISYQVEENKVKIFLRSKTNSFTPQDVSFTTDKIPVDAIVLLECKSLEDLGKLFENHTSLFYETPKICIDNQAANEYFGSINLIDLTASSVAEILAGLFEKYEQQLIDEHIATCLLAGIITKTNSFQHSQTTPKAFLHASQLVALGGRQQEIVKNLYKTKTIEFLKLWGRTLAQLKFQEDSKVVYSVLDLVNFEGSKNPKGDLLEVFKELLNNVSNYNIIGIIGEVGAKQVNILVAANSQTEITTLFKEFGKDVKILPLPQYLYTVASLELADIPVTEIENKLMTSAKNLSHSRQ